MHWNDLLPHIRHLGVRQQKRVREAYELGRELHDGQWRKSGEPYFTHPVAVAKMLGDIGADADTIIATLLHDTIEDTHMSLHDVEEVFGVEVMQLIDGVTKLTKEEMANHPSMDERIETLRKMFTLLQQDVRIMVIKLYDRLHNMHTIRFLPRDRQRTLAEETREVYVKIADRLAMQDMRDDLEELCIQVLEPEEYAALQEFRSANREKGMDTLLLMKQQMQKEFRIPSTKIDLHYEPKSWETLRERRHADSGFAGGRSHVTVVLIVSNVSMCYETLGILHQLWRRETLSFQDYINAPSVNGYRGLHTTVLLTDGTRVRCKIRTRDMQEYAHRGITLLCFDDRAVGLEDYLPWTKRIAPLAEDTEGRSGNFWESLQSDILGESIVIHGPADETLLLPRNATALDGVFYLFGELALRVEDIFINGQKAHFVQELQNGASVTATFAAEPTIHHSWLQWIRTGIASALIHQELGKRSLEEKIASGKWLLQEHLTRRRRGFLSEFDVRSMEDRLRLAGYDTLETVYVRLSEGRASVEEIERALFPAAPRRAERRGDRVSYILRCTVPDSARQVLVDLLQFADTIKIRAERMDGMIHYDIQVQLTEEERAQVEGTLSGTLDRDTWTLRRAYVPFFTAVGIFVLFLLWGLDPVFAHLLLREPHITPLALMLVRFWSLTVMSGILLLLARARTPIPATRLSLRNASLWQSVFLLICVALGSYLSLQSTLPSHYTIPMTSAGLLLTSIVNRHRWHILAITWSLLLFAFLILLFRTPQWTATSVVMTVLAVVSFSAFSVISERYKKQEFVQFRSAQYFFLLSFFCALVTLPLAPFADFTVLSHSQLARMALFSIFLAGLPYYMYYYLLSHKQIDFVLRYSFLIILVSCGGQVLFGLPLSATTILAGGMVMAGAVLPLLLNSQQTSRNR